MDKLTPEQEAEKLYPLSLFDNLDSSIKKDLQRSAHITAARMYMGEVDKIVEERDKYKSELNKLILKYAELSEQAEVWRKKSER